MELLNLLLGFIILLYSAILHEIAHGYVAERLGDPTARLMGRLTLDPRKHIDPILSILLPLTMYIFPPHIAIGGAKPVPVDPFNLKDGRKDVALVSLAGPVTNIILAILGASILKLLPIILAGNQALEFSAVFIFVRLLLNTIVNINIFLAIFNLLPIPPLDGSKIFALILPNREASMYLSLGQFGIFILFFLLAFPIGGFSLQEFIYNLFVIVHNLLGV